MTARQRLACALLCTFWLIFGLVRLSSGSLHNPAAVALTLISVTAGALGLGACAIGYVGSRR